MHATKDGDPSLPASLRAKLSPPSPFLYTSLQTVDILQQDLLGRIVSMKISNRSFELFEIKSLVLELPLDIPAAATAQEAQGPPAHPIFKGATQNYYVIPDFETFLKIHKHNQIYRIQPRKARYNQAYVAMKEITCAHGSPFTMSDRVDPHNYRMVMRTEWESHYKEWNEGPDARSHNFNVSGGQPIGFDGMFIAAHDAGVVLVNQQMNEKAVSTITGSIAFLKFLNSTVSRRSVTDFDNIWADFLKRRRIHLFLCGDRGPTRDALGFARLKGVHMYSRFGPYFRYCL